MTTTTTSKSKLLFILKYRDAKYTDETSYSNESYSQGGLSSGLLNSAGFVVDMLTEMNIEAKLIQVIDNNCIDREVTAYKPTHVVLEAYWCVPSKMDILTKLHPNVQWIIRNHSEIPFLATEGIAIDWTLEYLKYPNVSVSANSERALHEMKVMAEAVYGPDAKEKVIYLPNYYTFTDAIERVEKEDSDTIDIGCFGAIRPLKNQLIQAVAAIDFSKRIGKKLRFHINATRIEGNGNNVLKNIQALFDHTGEDYQLVEHSWAPHADFVKVCASMDLAMQVSFTETFNIVGADLVSMNVPLVVSHDIRWAGYFSKADSTCSKDMVRKMLLAWYTRKLPILQVLNRLGLESNIADAKLVWGSLFL